MSISQATTRFRVLLIDPPEATGGYNVGLAYLASSAKHAGHEVEVLDLNNAYSLDPERKIKQAVKDKDYVGISVHSFSVRNSARETARLIKRHNPNCVLLVGGPCITIDGNKFLNECPDADIGVMGDGELVLVDILARKPLQDIPGLMFREGNNITVTVNRKTIKDLDSLPHPDYSVFDSRDAIASYFTVTSRGCPYRCAYCSVPMLNNYKWRFRSAENIIEEIRSISDRFDHFAIIDDTFTQKISRAKAFCAEYIESGIGLTWSCPCGVRADRLDEELVELMKRSGCTRVALGIETLDEDVFASLDKEEKLSDVTKALELLMKHRIGVTALLIVGLPGSTYEIDKCTIEKIRTLSIGSIVSIFAPYPGTEAADRIANNPEFEFTEDIKGASRLPKHKPRVFVSSRAYGHKEVEHMYYYANLRLDNYEVLLESRATWIRKGVQLAYLILKYDRSHIMTHLAYIAKAFMKG